MKTLLKRQEEYRVETETGVHKIKQNLYIFLAYSRIGDLLPH